MGEGSITREALSTTRGVSGEKRCCLGAEAEQVRVIWTIFFHPIVGAGAPEMGLRFIPLMPVGHPQEEKVKARTPTVGRDRAFQSGDRGLPIAGAEMGDPQCVPVSPTFRCPLDSLLGQQDRARDIALPAIGGGKQEPGQVVTPVEPVPTIFGDVGGLGRESRPGPLCREPGRLGFPGPALLFLGSRQPVVPDGR